MACDQTMETSGIRVGKERRRVAIEHGVQRVGWAASARGGDAVSE